MMALSPDFRRVLAVLLLLVALMAVQEALVAPLVGLHRQLDADWQSGQERLRRYEQMAAALSQLEEARRRLAATAEEPSAYLSEGSEAVALAGLQESVKAAIEGNGAQVTGIRVLPAQDEDSYRRLGLHVTMTATLALLQKALYELESGPVLLFLDDVKIQRSEAARAGDRAATADDPQLDVAFDLFAFRRMPSQ